MEKKKRQLLEHTFQTFMEVGMGNLNYDILTDITSKDFVGFGTAIDEKLFGLAAVQKLIQRQIEQGKGLEISFETDTLDIHFSQDENTAIYTNDVVIQIVTGSDTIEMYVRVSMVLEYMEDKWKVVHFHTSKPEQVQSEKDTWGLETWKERAEMLEKEVAERTEDLVLKNRELEIEAALERVRTRALAMNSSEELPEVALELRKQMGILGQLDLEVCVIHLYEEDENYFESWGAMRAPGEEGKIFQGLAKFPNSGIAIVDEMMAHYHAGDKDYILINEGEKAQEWFQVLKKYAPEIYRVLSKTFELTPKDQLKAYWAMADFEGGSLGMVTYAIPDPDALKLLRQSANVFQLAHRRYRDLQKAEAQAREARIEAALERTRTKSMLMKHSDELNEISKVFHEQLLDLGIDSEFSFVWLPDEEKVEHLFWATWQNKKNGKAEIHSKSIAYPMDLSEPTTLTCLADWKSGVSIHEHFVPPAEIKNFFVSWEELLRGSEKLRSQNFPDGIYYTEAFMKYGCFGIDIRRPLSEKEKTILNRFAIEFERAYTRFLDLQKAEEQTKEAQIEAALERVRAQTMAMHNSEDVGKCIVKMFGELTSLGVHEGTRFGIGILNHDNENNQLWTAKKEEEEVKIHIGHLDMTSHPLLKSARKAWKDQIPLHKYILEGEDLQNYYKMLNKAPDYKIKIPLALLPEKEFHYGFIFEHGFFYAFSPKEFGPDLIAIIHRFSTQFSQTYRRYLDLVKAEAQAREAQIEAALERVRSRTMGMQHSVELPEVANLMFLEIQSLGIPAWSCGYCILLEDRRSSTCIMSSEGTLQKPFLLPHHGEDSFEEWDKFVQGKDSFFVQELGGESLQSHYRFMKSLPQLTPVFQDLENAGLSLPTYQINHLCKFGQGFLLFITYEKVPETHNIFKRFTKVFDQTYTRFLDLQKAEAQAREAKIEAALERVRSHSMGMQNSGDFGNVTTEMFNQLRNFGADLFATGIVFCDKHEGHVEQWHSIPGGGMLSPMIVPIDLDYIHQYRYDQWKAGKELFSVEIPEDFIEQHFEDIFKLPSAQITLKDLESRNAPMPKTPPWEIDYGASFKNGYILISSLRHFENTDILPRFAKVFEQAYTRFLDLQVAEAQAREAQIEAALERVRSRTLAMQNSDELAETAVVVFKQLIDLGIEPNRLYFGIITDNSGDIEFWATDEDGSKISSKFTGNKNNNPSLRKMYDAWLAKEKTLTLDMRGAELEEYFNYLGNELHVPFRKGLLQKRRVQTMSFFSKGFIGMASPDEQPGESMEILERFAHAFNLTFTRFNDLKVAEANALQAEQDLIAIKEAKQKAERALTELKSAQAQLIQAEKMASLGELTAGIAHEIQNPLNFVNNFSEVSTELIDEVEEERNKKREERDEALVSELMADLKENLKKINFHGKRAGEIVKGMLQHSRASTGEKELTDLNVLADEYLRLAYHGLRAKDKNFNAHIESDFEADLPKMKVVAQDIGRVLLNLITNAFYAVNEKKKKGETNYEPKVSVSTKKEGNKILIRVKDNGDGIPEALKEKIFQPFFTTKPTGSGTGLGLSLSYDIAKAHGGELKVESRPAEKNDKNIKETVFSLCLPLEN